MIDKPEQITLEQWDRRYDFLKKSGLQEPHYGGRLSRHAEDGDQRLTKLKFDNSPAALRLWNFLLTEEDRLEQARTEGKKIIGTMKDLGTVPGMAYSFDKVVAFYPDAPAQLPCKVFYAKPDENVLPRGLWESKNTHNYCEQKAVEFIEKLSSQVWHCYSDEL